MSTPFLPLPCTPLASSLIPISLSLVRMWRMTSWTRLPIAMLAFVSPATSLYVLTNSHALSSFYFIPPEALSCTTHHSSYHVLNWQATESGGIKVPSLTYIPLIGANHGSDLRALPYSCSAAPKDRCHSSSPEQGGHICWYALVPSPLLVSPTYPIPSSQLRILSLSLQKTLNALFSFIDFNRVKNLFRTTLRDHLFVDCIHSSLLLIFFQSSYRDRGDSPPRSRYHRSRQDLRSTPLDSLSRLYYVENTPLELLLGLIVY